MQNYKTGELEFADYRISKSAWLKENEDIVVANVAKRVEVMTGLTTETAEELQVVNYGVGGHYDPHYDFARVCIKVIQININFNLYIILFSPKKLMHLSH